MPGTSFGMQKQPLGVNNAHAIATIFILPCQICMEAMKSDVDEVVLQGIEFWSTICDEEMDLAIEAAEVISD